MKELKDWTNEENLELAVNELNIIIDEIGNINLATESQRKEGFKRLHKNYDRLIILRKRLANRLKSLKEEEECIISQQENGLQN